MSNYSEQRSKVYPIDADVGTLSDVNKKVYALKFNCASTSFVP